jgi:hypothetical protein
VGLYLVAFENIRVKRRAPLEKLGNTVPDVLSSIVKEQKRGEIAELQYGWKSIVGDRVAAVTYPTAFRDGVLTIKVRSAVWRQELHSEQESLKETICKNMDNIELTQIIFR